MESPCIDVCVIEPATGLCSGCRRTLAEIAAWGSLTSRQRADVMAALPGRRDARPPVAPRQEVRA